jgi:nicotinamide/nicotinate riboside kinase
MSRRLPVKDGLLDWDCAEALAIPDIVKSLDCIQRYGTFPVRLTMLQTSTSGELFSYWQSDFDSKEDRNDVGKCPVSDFVIESLKAKVHEWTQPGHPGHDILNSSPSSLRLCILDGFLLYSPSMASIQKHMDIKLFLRVSYAKAKVRREARSGYATIEGFWEDPPGYVEKIVWPNYVLEHQWMFENGDVEGKLKDDVLTECKINTQADKGLDVDMETTLNWAVETLMKELEKLKTK